MIHALISRVYRVGGGTSTYRDFQSLQNTLLQFSKIVKKLKIWLLTT